MVNVGIVATGSYLGPRIIPNSYFSGIMPDGSLAEDRNPYVTEYGEGIIKVEDKKIRVRGLLYQDFGRDEKGDHYLDKRVVVSNEGIETLTGIKERRWAYDSQKNIDFLVEAFKNTEFPADSLDGIIVASITSDRSFSSLPNLLQEKMGIVRNISERDKFRDFLALEYQAACYGFTHGLDQARLLIQEGGRYKFIFVSGCDILSRILDKRDKDYDLLADTSAGAVFGQVKKGRGILATTMGSDGRGSDWVYMDENGYFRMPCGKKVYKNGSQAMETGVEVVCDRAGVDVRDVKWVIPHQANLRILNQIEKDLQERHKCNIQVYKNIDRVGNTSASSCAAALNEAIRNGTLGPDDLFVLTTVGAGMNSSAALILGYDLINPLGQAA